MLDMPPGACRTRVKGAVATSFASLSRSCSTPVSPEGGTVAAFLATTSCG